MALGGKVELQEQISWGKVASIRDPVAGSTCYEGSEIVVKPDSNLHGIGIIVNFLYRIFL